MIKYFNMETFFAKHNPENPFFRLNIFDPLMIFILIYDFFI